MLWRFLCSSKAFLNYVPGVYRYLKATGVPESQAYLVFGRSRVERCLLLLDIFHSSPVRRQVHGPGDV